MKLLASEESQIVPVPCVKCGQINIGQSGEYPCTVCKLATVWDEEITDSNGKPIIFKPMRLA